MEPCSLSSLAPWVCLEGPHWYSPAALYEVLVLGSGQICFSLVHMTYGMWPERGMGCLNGVSDSVAPGV